MDFVQIAERLMGSPYLYVLLFGMAVLDAVLPLLPSEVILILTGVFAASGRPPWPLVILAATVGMVVGDCVSYSAGRGLIGRWPHSRPARVAAKAAAALRRRGGQFIVVGRFVPGGRIAVNTASGATRYPLVRFAGLRRDRRRALGGVLDAARRLRWCRLRP
ncbi:VTT domain-containing protein [Couchioplanes caeruleus]|uniref:DedA family protein n=1 Tax=Couchioplanes caeruleus TaxID=56438 RepID=UPI0020BF823E|nr:VTT domain-containing protein [Couchioplanes caeruleus]UQU62215.1 VTT domain-containing protein [Couchioplanes caeruleus]